MKYILAFLLLHFCIGTRAQFSKGKGTWFSIDQDRFSFMGNGQSMFENSDNYHLYFEKVIENGNSIKLYLNEQSPIQDKEYKIQLHELNDSFFTLKPISKSSIKLFSNREEVKFYREGYLIDNDLIFEKLIYSKTPSGNYYSDGITILIDSSKNLRYKNVSALDSTQTGNFTGKLTEKGYYELIRILKKTHLRRLKWPSSEYYGQDKQELVLYFNGERKELQTNTDAPFITSELLAFLRNIEKYSQIKRTTKYLRFEY